MSTLSTEENARQTRDNTRQNAAAAFRDDDLNPVVGVIDRSWQQLLTQSERISQRLQRRWLSYDDAPTLRQGARAWRGRR